MIEIFYRAGCPYCDKVLKAADRMGLISGQHYQAVDAGIGTPGRDTVIKLGGKAMVPFLKDGAHTMYESDDIIEYLRNKFTSPQ